MSTPPPLKTYRGASNDSHTGSSGFTNYFNNKPNPEAVFKDLPTAVIIDGSDDWFSPIHKCPMQLVRDWGIQPLAWFHSGISGMVNSGVVLSVEEAARFAGIYFRTFGLALSDAFTVYRQDEVTKGS